jgi:hypothetical protein
LIQENVSNTVGKKTYTKESHGSTIADLMNTNSDELSDDDGEYIPEDQNEKQASKQKAI